MRAFSKWDAPLGVFQVLTLGILLVGSMFAWILYFAPHLSSLLASQAHFAETYPFLYDVAHNGIAFMALPVSFASAFVGSYFFQRRYDRKMQREKTRAV